MKKGNKKILVFDTIEEMSGFALAKWREAAESAIRRSGRFTVALSGGKTPLPFYKSLAGCGRNLPWEKTHIFLTDERFVPHDGPDSNFGMIKSSLLKNVGVPDANIHPIYFDNTAESAADRYEEDIRNFFKLKRGRPPRFDLIILGMGEDGHTASLFPECKALSENRRLACRVASPAIKNERITLTFPAINNARIIIFLITGRSKAHITSELIEKENSRLPAFLVNPGKGELFYLMDKEAASSGDLKYGF